MKFRTAVLSLVAILIVLASGPAHAKLMFGKDDTIHFIQDVKVKGAKGEELFLGYKTSIQYFLAGLYVADEGYVLGIKSDRKKFYNMPTGAELKSFQSRGLLPDPLPPYSLNFFDYLLGYSLWIVLAIIVAWFAFGWLRKRRARESAIS